MAMLVLATQAFPDRVVVATVDHGLRADAAGEAAMVAACCADLRVAHRILTPDAPLSGASIQAVARHARYALLGEWALSAGATLLLTAHHADDQAETFLMRAARGSGPGGLAGIRQRWVWEQHRWHGGYPRGGVVAVADMAALPVVRPLLGWRRADLRQIAEAAAIPFVDDPSNTDARYDRVRVRQLLATGDALDAGGLARSATICAEIDRDFAATIDWLRRTRMCASDAYACCYDMAGLPRELRRRLTRDAIGYVRDVCAINEGNWSDGTNVEALLDALESGRSATQAGVMASAEGDQWRFRQAPPRRSR